MSIFRLAINHSLLHIEIVYHPGQKKTSPKLLFLYMHTMLLSPSRGNTVISVCSKSPGIEERATGMPTTPPRVAPGSLSRTHRDSDPGALRAGGTGAQQLISACSSCPGTSSMSTCSWSCLLSWGAEESVSFEKGSTRRSDWSNPRRTARASFLSPTNQ